MRVTSAPSSLLSSAVSRVFRDSSRLSVGGPASLDAALSDAALPEDGPDGSVSNSSCVPGVVDTGSPPQRMIRSGWAESLSSIFSPAERLSQPLDVCMA